MITKRDLQAAGFEIVNHDGYVDYERNKHGWIQRFTFVTPVIGLEPCRAYTSATEVDEETLSQGMDYSKGYDAAALRGLSMAEVEEWFAAQPAPEEAVE